jgi:flavorubredoxin
MPFPPLEPTIRVEPTEIAEDTFVLHQVQEATGAPLFVYINSMVIRGEQPVIVDTGAPANRKQILEDIFSLVEPEDVRWVYLSHDDVDHSGNLDEVLSACPNATLVVTWPIVERHTNCFDFPLPRCRWVMDGESFDVGDRVLHAMRPPIYDSPTTRGLFDSSTGVYWSVDTMATPLQDPSHEVADLDDEFWNYGLTLFAHAGVSPWLAMVDPAKYAQTVDRIQSLGVTTLAGCHTPVFNGAQVDTAFEKMRMLPTAPVPPIPDQAALEQIVAAMTGTAAG